DEQAGGVLVRSLRRLFGIGDEQAREPDEVSRRVEDGAARVSRANRRIDLGPELERPGADSHPAVRPHPGPGDLGPAIAEVAEDVQPRPGRRQAVLGEWNGSKA